jgi:hypothetical protein
MAKIDYTALSKEELVEKEKNLKGLILVFIPIIIGLVYVVVQNYLSGEEMDWAMITIAICSLGGPATLYPQLKEVREELKRRA